MANEGDVDQSAELIRQLLAEQETLKQRFEAASPAEDYKEDIDLGESYKEVTEFRMDKNDFLVKHVPTELLNQWPVMTGPRRLKTSVESWVDEVAATFSPKDQD